MDPAFRLSSPCSDAEFERYFELRWQLLRAPWNQPRGSEQDDLETEAFHLQAQGRSDELVGIARLHRIDDSRGQIRYMAVVEDWRGHGIGTALLLALERQAQDWGLKEIRLHAREGARGFYTHHGYAVVAPSHTLFGSIPHSLMRKPLDGG